MDNCPIDGSIINEDDEAIEAAIEASTIKPPKKLGNPLMVKGNQLAVGHDGSNAGRPVGSKTKMHESFEMVGKITEEIVTTLVDILRRKPQKAQKVARSGEVVDYWVYPSNHDVYEVAIELLNRRYGKVKQTVDVNATQITDFNITITVKDKEDNIIDLPMHEVTELIDAGETE